ncbi:hypothetical protein KC640_01505 [Candidatus Dojkabacteria bacterium]|uniref:Uncharacterized protein n=1 Tax=Candidatus Dojkabacteria bacterium TaxID=2099670 RepID=A0A955I521_9BACT|nr:hypothetical protein [Candidatus Dojkabacteria bacterium]
MRITPRAIILLLLFAALAGGVVFLLNKGQLDQASSARIVVSPEDTTAVETINFGDVVEVTGTPDLLNAVSLEDRNGGEIYEYFVPLKEYGTTFVVQIKKSKLRTEQQTFTGITTGLASTEHDTRIKNRLNKPVELDDQDRADLDADTIEILTEQTTNEFTSKTILIFDGEVPEPANVYTSIFFWSVLLFMAAVTALRHYIFR